MDLPRNITQVGETDRNCKIYVEDYVVSYMKQMNKFAEDKEISVALYGKMSVEQQVTYCFVYGACVIQSVSREIRHLSQAQTQEIERLRRKYFPEQTFLGYQILNGEMIEGFRIYDQNSCRYVKGYACFFEKNDAMLAYMLETRPEEAQPEIVEQDKYDMVRKRQEDRKVQFEERGQNKRTQTRDIDEKKENERFKVVPFVALAGCCLVAMTLWRNDDVMETAKNQVAKWTAGLTEMKLAAENREGQEMNEEQSNSDATPEQEEVQAVMGTLVTEDKLAEAILKENENAAGETTSSEASETISGEEQEAASAEADADNTSSEGNADGGGTDSETGANSENNVSGAGDAGSENNVSGAGDTNSENNAGGESTDGEAGTSSKPQVPARPEAYTICQGDTLIAISKRVYGDDKFVSDICALNNISNPDNIQIGQKILLP